MEFPKENSFNFSDVDMTDNLSDYRTVYLINNCGGTGGDITRLYPHGSACGTCKGSSEV